MVLRRHAVLACYGPVSASLRAKTVGPTQVHGTSMPRIRRDCIRPTRALRLRHRRLFKGQLFRVCSYVSALGRDLENTA
eukprot:1392885-Rhodomonas_salina.1